MDLKYRNQAEIAYHFLNQYCTLTGDYAGIPLLKAYEIYRAMVRAKITALMLAPNKKVYLQYLNLANTLIHPPTPFLIILTGVSGSGKTWLSTTLSAKMQAIHLRSDVERKRLFPRVKGAALYTPEKTKITFQKLYLLSEYLLKNNNSVIVDAAFLRKAGRQVFFKLSKQLKVPFLIIDCQAPLSVLKSRIQKRLRQNDDYSDATLKVLTQQLNSVEPLSSQEFSYSIQIKTHKPLNFQKLIQKINRQFFT